MFAAEFSSLCGSPSGAQRQHVGRTGPLTQQHRVFERFPRDDVNAWITRVNPQIAVSSDAHYLSDSFICMSYLCLFLFLDAQSSDALQTHFYQTASRLFLCLFCLCLCFSLFCMPGDDQEEDFFLSAFYDCFYFSYRWHCIFHVYSLSCPKREGEIILMY